MRSFYTLSLVLNVLLSSCSPGQALLANRHEKSGARYRHVNSPKRDANVAFTYFEDGKGACGGTNGPNDFIVAIDSGEYDGGAHCFESITINVGGKTTQAVITDECMGCEPGGLDFSMALFQYFSPLGAGKIYGSWSYNSDISTPSSTAPASTTTSTLAPTTTTTTLSTTTMTSSASSAVPSATSITSSVPSSIPQAPQVIAQIDLALIELSALLQVSASLQAW